MQKRSGFPKKVATDSLEREEIVLPLERGDAGERDRGQSDQPVRKEIRVRPKPAPVLSVFPVRKENKKHKDLSGEQAFVAEDFFHGKNLPMAIILAEVFSPPRSKRRFR